MAAGQDVLRLMDTARVRLPGATDAAIQLELFAVMDEFFKETNSWMEDIDVFVKGGQRPGTVIELTQTSPSLIDKLMWITYRPDENNSFSGAPIGGAAMQIPGELTLRTMPTTDTWYRVTVSKTVADPTQRDGYVTFPAWVLQRYRDVILDGLLGKMMSQPNKPFTNQQLGVYYLRKWITGYSDARVQVQRNNSYRAQAWRYPGFAGGNQKGRFGRFQPQ